VVPEKPKGIVFDLDGTIINSTIDFPRMKRHMIKVLEADGIPAGVLTPNETTVVTLAKTEKIWEQQGKPEDEKEKIRGELEGIMNQVEFEAIPLIEEIEGAVDAVRRLKKMNFKLAILTRSHHNYAVKALMKIGAYQYFDLILGRGETRKPKPHAEALKHTSELMGLTLDEILFVGDHHIDSMCAENADCHFVGVRTGPRGDDSWEQHRPETLLNSVGELPDYLANL
jgi:phosphoglycolate phosphatase